MRDRTLYSLVLAVLLAAACGQTGAGQTQPKDKKDESPGRTKPTEPKWPTEIGGKDMKAWLKDITDPDPAIREAALTVLPNFGPEVRKVAAKPILARMKFPSAGGEPDPGVRLILFDAASLIGFEDSKDETEAIRLLGLTVDLAPSGSHSRLHALQTLASIGPKAEPVVSLVAGIALKDHSYKIRQNIARTLGQIGINEKNGPNKRALQALAATLARDESVPVRMEALQSLVLLGPPWAAPLPAGAKGPPKYDLKAADSVAEVMRSRINTPKAKGAELDKQLEIWCRVVLMRFDPKEITDENLAAIARHLTAPDAGPKVQALQALALFGEQAGSQLDSVVGVIRKGDNTPNDFKDDEHDMQVLNMALGALGSMGVKAQAAIPQLQSFEKRLAAMRDEKRKSPEIAKILAGLKDEKER
jgi:HEAT repeat protein